MKSSSFTGAVLLAIAVLLAVLALQPLFVGKPVFAEAPTVNLYIEPGTTMIQAPDRSAQFYGKVVVDLETGKIWGFPTMSQAPYPIDAVHTTPPVSHPVYLGKYDLAAMTK